MKKVWTLPLALAGSCYALWIASPALSNSSTKEATLTTDNNLGLTKTYIWGNGVYQPRPDAQLRFRNYEPKLIKTFMGPDNINLQDITFGEDHEGGIGANGNVYVWNKHKLDSSVSQGDNERGNIVCLDDSKDNRQISFSKNQIWVLKESGDVFQYDILKLPGTTNQPPKVLVNPVSKQIDGLKDIVQISTGEDHIAALDCDGFVWTLGDDTLGQCGQGAQRRNCAPPFFEKKVNRPYRISSLPNIVKVVCGGHHTLALNEDGVAYGWGNNSNLQLSHEMEFSAPDNPLLAIFSPLRIEKNLGPIVISDIAAGDEFSIFVGKNRYNRETEAFGCGRNLHGELGAGTLRHIQDVVKIQSLSNYKVKSAEGESDIKVEQVSCGKNHCMALLNIGAVLEWGANEHGQLGNRKRVFSENPIVVKDLSDETILKVSCGHSNSAVICDVRGDIEPKPLFNKPQIESRKSENSTAKSKNKKNNNEPEWK